MKITVFTSNQPRHLHLLHALAAEGHQVQAVLECTTAFPGQTEDFYRNSEVMRRYFGLVLEAEREVFGPPSPTPAGCPVLALRMGDLNRMSLEGLEPVLAADQHVVFGASYLKGELAGRLVERGALNLHMGVSPEYRGTATNFWPLWDGRAHLVGATLHLLSRGLDSGDIVRHAFPPRRPTEPFRLGMLAVRAGQLALLEELRQGPVKESAAVAQDRRQELRYSRKSDFTDQVAEQYLARLPGSEEVGSAMEQWDPRDYVRPFVG